MALKVFVGVAAIFLIAAIIWDAFEALVLPRRVTRRLRPTRFFYRTTWQAWRAIALRMPSGARRETYLSFYGPLSLLLLISLWATCLVVGFAALHWAVGARLIVGHGAVTFGTVLYMSGTTFFTLGLGDVTPVGAAARIITVVESGMGFGFLALVIGYLPVLYQGFSRREVSITLLDARAGSPPSAGELLRRHGRDLDELTHLFRDWERWSAEVLESHLSYPVLSFFRSQHDNQSWLAALTAILDSSALALVGIEGVCARQAQLTFAMARHAVADLAQVLGTPPRTPHRDRLPAAEFHALRRGLGDEGVVLAADDGTHGHLSRLRLMYEPYVSALSERLLMPLPSWSGPGPARDNWRTSAWGSASTVPVAPPPLGVEDAEP
jgi:hypothetical protein